MGKASQKTAKRQKNNFGNQGEELSADHYLIINEKLNTLILVPVQNSEAENSNEKRK